MATPVKPIPLMIAFSVIFLVMGCTKVSELQANCKSSTRTFPSMIDCLEQKVASNERMRESDLVRLYVSYAKLAAEKVENGNMTEAEADVILSEVYSKLKEREGERNEENFQKLQQSLNMIAKGLKTSPSNSTSQPNTFGGDAEFTRVCYYSCLGSRVAVNVDTTKMCPWSITRNGQTCQLEIR